MTKDEARAYVIRHCNPDYPKGKTEWERAINMAIKALEQPEQPTWIPCSERLPEKETEVIYSLENIVSTGYMTDRDYYGSVTDLHWKDVECGARICPEAWMPMPSPWKGDK